MLNFIQHKSALSLSDDVEPTGWLINQTAAAQSKLTEDIGKKRFLRNHPKKKSNQIKALSVATCSVLLLLSVVAFVCVLFSNAKTSQSRVPSQSSLSTSSSSITQFRGVIYDVPWVHKLIERWIVLSLVIKRPVKIIPWIEVRRSLYDITGHRPRRSCRTVAASGVILIPIPGWPYDTEK